MHKLNIYSANPLYLFYDVEILSAKSAIKNLLTQDYNFEFSNKYRYKGPNLSNQCSKLAKAVFLKIEMHFVGAIHADIFDSPLFVSPTLQ